MKYELNYFSSFRPKELLFSLFLKFVIRSFQIFKANVMQIMNDSISASKTVYQLRIKNGIKYRIRNKIMISIFRERRAEVLARYLVI